MRATPRLMQIMGVLIRHKFPGAMFGQKHWPAPKEVRKSFEELGLVFIKLGQVLALRRDLIPAAYADELDLLHDQLPPMSIEMVRAAVECEFGAPLGSLFSSFSITPFAAATIAQVHEATTKEGRHVAVKVQRPDLKTIIARDIAALTHLVGMAEGLLPSLRAVDLPVVVRDRHAPHPATDRRRRPGPASRPGGHRATLQPQSRAAHRCHRFRGSDHRRLHAVAHPHGWLASRSR